MKMGKKDLWIGRIGSGTAIFGAFLLVFLLLFYSVTGNMQFALQTAYIIGGGLIVLPALLTIYYFRDYEKKQELQKNSNDE